MLKFDFHPAGHHFVRIPGSKRLPARILRAISYPTFVHRGPECGAHRVKVLDGIKTVFKTTQPVRFPKAAVRAVVALTSSAFGSPYC